MISVEIWSIFFHRLISLLVLPCSGHAYAWLVPKFPAAHNSVFFSRKMTDSLKDFGPQSWFYDGWKNFPYRVSQPPFIVSRETPITCPSEPLEKSAETAETIRWTIDRFSCRAEKERQNFNRFVEAANKISGIRRVHDTWTLDEYPVLANLSCKLSSHLLPRSIL